MRWWWVKMYIYWTLEKILKINEHETQNANVYVAKHTAHDMCWERENKGKMKLKIHKKKMIMNITYFKFFFSFVAMWMCVIVVADGGYGGFFVTVQRSAHLIRKRDGRQLLVSNGLFFLQNFSIHYTTGVLYHVSFYVCITNNDINITAGEEKAN